MFFIESRFRYQAKCGRLDAIVAIGVAGGKVGALTVGLGETAGSSGAREEGREASAESGVMVSLVGGSDHIVRCV